MNDDNSNDDGRPEVALAIVLISTAATLVFGPLLAMLLHFMTCG